MKKLTRAQLFAPGQRGPRKTKDWFERAKLVVAAARDSAVETAQQRAVPSIKRPPTVWQRRRLVERLSRSQAWPENLAITTPQERHPESAVKISKASVATRTSPKQ
jgi:hypothetical protein